VKFKTKARSLNCAKTFQYQNGLNTDAEKSESNLPTSNFSHPSVKTVKWFCPKSLRRAFKKTEHT